MNRTQRAKQFAPFDALKGLQSALRLKEFEHDRVTKGDIQEEKANEISKTLLSLEKNDVVKATYFKSGHNYTVQGKAKIIVEEKCLQIGRAKINLDDLLDVVILKYRI